MSINTFRGFPYPVFRNANGMLSPTEGLEQIKADLRHLLNTQPRERVMLPEFGTPLRQLAFNPNDEMVRQEARKIVSNAIENEEPRVIINKIDVESGSATSVSSRRNDQREDNYIEEDHVLRISLELIDPENLKSIDSLILNRPFGAT